jgi:DNA repair protein RadA/Sms
MPAFRGDTSVAKRLASAYVCGDCGAEYTKWQGQCGDCGAWNTLAEIRLAAVTGGGATRGFAGAADGTIVRLADV